MKLPNPCIDCREQGEYGLKLHCTAGFASKLDKTNILEEKLISLWICLNCTPLWKKLVKHLKDVQVTEPTSSEDRWMKYVKKMEKQIMNKEAIELPYYRLNLDEAKALQKFIISTGYISHEFNEPIHKLSRNIDLFLGENEEDERKD